MDTDLVIGGDGRGIVHGGAEGRLSCTGRWVLARSEGLEGVVVRREMAVVGGYGGGCWWLWCLGQRRRLREKIMCCVVKGNSNNAFVVNNQKIINDVKK